MLLVAAARAGRVMGAKGTWPTVHHVPAHRRTRRAAFSWLSAGPGFLRGVGDLRTPLLIPVGANVVNLALEVLFVYGFDGGSRARRGAR